MFEKIIRMVISPKIKRLWVFIIREKNSTPGGILTASHHWVAVFKLSEIN